MCSGRNTKFISFYTSQKITIALFTNQPHETRFQNETVLNSPNDCPQTLFSPFHINSGVEKSHPGPRTAAADRLSGPFCKAASWSVSRGSGPRTSLTPQKGMFSLRTGLAWPSYKQPDSVHAVSRQPLCGQSPVLAS